MVRQRQSPITVHGVAGRVKFLAPYGQDPETRQWLCPTREHLGLGPRQELTPELEDRLCYTATQSLSYESAANTATKWGVSLAPSTIFKHVQQVGAKVRQRHEAQVQRALNPATRAEVIAEAKQAAPEPGTFSLVLMIDAWKIRERGEQWGEKPPDQREGRVEWRDMKTGIVFRLEDRAETQGARRLILEKHFEAFRGDPYEFGRRFYALALRQGLNQARAVYVLADGAMWIWNLVEDRFGRAMPLLDFYHASQHLWAVAHALHAKDQAAARAWVEPILHQLKHGEQGRVLQGLQGLNALLDSLEADPRKTVENGQAYFEERKHLLNYAKAAAQGCPIGSGAIESTCSQLEDRFQRTGQFWIFDGHSNLMSLDLARRNGRWQQIWEISERKNENEEIEDAA